MTDPIPDSAADPAPARDPIGAVDQRPRVWLHDVSHVSQIVGSIAVVASLVYVGLQVQQNTRQLQREESNATQSQWQAIRLLVASNREVAELWVAGLNGDALDAVQRLRFDSLLREHVWATSQIYYRGKAGVFGAGEFESTSGPPLARQLCTRGGALWWQKNKLGFPADFVRDVGATMTRLPPEERVNCPTP
jgi:hypothetical protein